MDLHKAHVDVSHWTGWVLPAEDMCFWIVGNFFQRPFHVQIYHLHPQVKPDSRAQKSPYY